MPQRHTKRMTTRSKHKRPVVPNILGREFLTAAPNLTWLSDITYVRTDEGWLYLAIMLDLYARRVVGWAMESYLVDLLTRRALQMALRRRRPAPALLHHSDRGSQYASQAYRELLFSHKGEVLDNAPMESFLRR